MTSNNDQEITDSTPTVEPTVETVAPTVKAKRAPAKPKAKKNKRTSKKRGESLTSPRRIHAVEVKQAEALEYRKQGYTYEQIAEALGYKTAQGAYAAIQSALTRIIREPAQEVLQIELERLDAMFMRPFAAATSGDLMAIGACLNIMARKAKLLGLDAPTKVDNTIANKNGAPLTTAVVNMSNEQMEAAAARLAEKYCGG